jgi:cyclopropane fatty-acyl-phospholipid synthase-like methyltransferase
MPRIGPRGAWVYWPNIDLAILDLGCSGGGFVKDCVDDGYVAIGLEGSDYSKNRRRAEWATIPDYLFTCDITERFDIVSNGNDGENRLLFDAITAWEVMEHIAEKDIPRVAENVKRHMKDGALWIMSVDDQPYTVDGRDLHQSVRPKEWWVDTFENLGFHHCEEYVRFFNTQFIRGAKYGSTGFHLVLTLDRDKAPTIPKESFVVRMYDRWLGSTLHRAVRAIVVGGR